MFLQEKIVDINKRLKVLRDIKNIAIWGAGVHTCKLFEKAELFNYDIQKIVDIDESKHGDYFFGFIVESPYGISWDNIQAVIISVPNREKQIAETLKKELKFSGKIVLLYELSENSSPFYQLYDKKKSQICYIGDYDNWNNAYSESQGYDDNTIIDKVASSIKQVLEGSATWERDGYLFYEKKYSYPICSAVLRCALQNHNQGVRILDIGGALGSTYFQNKEYFNNVKKLEYIIAEQDVFANYGHQNLENKVLKFIGSRQSYRQLGKIDIVFMSGSLQYISEYKEIIFKIIEAGPDYIILDRILVSNRTRICKEIVPKEIYDSSYPVRIFTEEEIQNFFGSSYRIIEKDISSVPEEAYFVDGKAESKYYVFEKIFK